MALRHRVLRGLLAACTAALLLAALATAHSHAGGRGHSHSHTHTHGHAHGDAHAPFPRDPAAPAWPHATRSPPVDARSWMEVCAHAFGATLLISAAPVVILVFIPLDASAGTDSPLLRTLLGFAVGGLLGDVFLHILPHTFSGSPFGRDPHVHGIYVGTLVMAGCLSFFAIEKFVRFLRGEDGAHGHGHSHGHTHAPTETSHSHAHAHADGDVNGIARERSRSPVTEGQKLRHRARGENSSPSRRKSPSRAAKGAAGEVSERSPRGNSTASASHDGKSSGSDETTPCAGESPPAVDTHLAVAGVLNLVADFTHNMTDGLAIGATFLSSQSLGLVTTIAILLHEVPHEVGDFAILVRSGVSKRAAILLQLTTAVGALMGTGIGLFLGAMDGSTEGSAALVLAFTAGGFIYVALVSVLPELLHKASPLQTLREIAAMAVGAGIMLYIAVFLEEH